MRPHSVRRALITIGATALVVPFLGGVGASASPSDRVSVAGATPTWATSASLAGTPAASDQVSFTVALPLHNAAGADLLAQQVSNPNSAQYQSYLSPAQFNARFAPTDASVARVKSFLSGQGITVTSVADGNRWVSASGTVAQVNKAFGTVMKTYSLRGKRLRAPSTAVSVPSSVAPDVAQVTGLDDSALLRKPMSVSIPDDGSMPSAHLVTPGATPPPLGQCSTYWGQHSQTVPDAYGKTSVPTNICGYSPQQLQGAYGVAAAIKAGQNGHGVTVAIIDAYGSPTMQSDANAYATGFGQPAFKAGQYSETLFQPFNLQTECQGEAGWNGEETLDVEAVHSLAPGATVHYFGAQNCDDGIDAALNYVVQHHSADIVSNSYGNAGEELPADEIQLEHSIFLQAAIEGMGMYFSSGDDGDDVTVGDTTKAEPDYPASDPMVTAVGGTSLAVDKHNNYQFETGWGSDRDVINYATTPASYTSPLPGSFIFGAGGGTSFNFTQPAYQRGVVPASLAKKNGSTAMRVVPDVGAIADPYTGFAVGQTTGGVFGLRPVGGTSLACPVFAGIQALASTGRRHAIGFANPLLYSLPSALYRDVTPSKTPIAVTTTNASGTVTLDRDTSLTTARGYDEVTGRGSPLGLLFLLAERLL
ncbi:S53 family peptidase [Rugosimonospora acidiphila]|uniref:S53 family peptidase n=1 Tax=Rugosimonospora acidiphila TaxID=556531 RepID=A0ABP9SHC2_9ACTN